MNKQDLKIVFLGTPDFAVESLDRLVTGGFNVVGVVTMPDKVAGRGHHVLQSPVKQYAVEHGLNLLQPVNLKDETFVNELRALGADLFIVIAFRMLPQIVWSMPPLGTFNLHASLLPRYRGAAPINRAVMNGDKSTGVTTFMLEHEIDTGDILQQQSIEIGPDEDAGSVHDRLMHLGADLTIDTVEHILAGDLKPVPQDELIGDTEPTPAPKIFAEDMLINWKQPAEDVHNHVRGLAPYPSARTTFIIDNQQFDNVKIHLVKPVDRDYGVPGTVTRTTDGRLFIACENHSAVEVLDLQMPGKKRMSAGDFLRGARFENISAVY